MHEHSPPTSATSAYRPSIPIRPTTAASASRAGAKGTIANYAAAVRGVIVKRARWPDFLAEV
jgi:hypothetical protein